MMETLLAISPIAIAIFAIETAWYSIVALALSAPSPRGAYLRSKSKVDRLAGGIMTALGIKLIVGARHV